MEGYEINPELKCIKLDEETKEKMKKLKPVDIMELLKNAKKNNIELTFSGIDSNGIPHIKVGKRQ
jgi:hypothetical protein